jgi:hypothetical protein
MDPTTCFNHDIVMIYDMCNRFIRELDKSQSSPVSGMTVHDITRVKSYSAAMKQLHSWIVSQPLLDLPETHPREYQLEAPPVPVNSESESVNMLVRLLEAMRTEMINSQSARYASTVIAHDSNRFLALITKLDNFVSEYVEVATPLDLPESSPGEPMTTPGFKGVNAP